MELREFQKVEDLNESSEQILCIRTHCSNHICITAAAEYDYKNAVSAIDFKLYKLDNSGDISQACIGRSFCEINGSVFCIADIGIEEQYRNNGYGSLLLSEIIKYAEQLNVTKIKGRVYCNDIKKKEAKVRLYHFYEEHGFVIDEGRLTLCL